MMTVIEGILRTLCLFLALTTVEASWKYEGAKRRYKKKVGDSRPTVLELEDRPEGVANGPGSTLLVSQILSGGVVALDVLTGEGKQVVPSQEDGSQAWGLWYHKGTIFVAGGGAPIGGGMSEVYAYDISTGDRLAACQPESEGEFGSFLNDITVRDGYAYITDSFNGKLMVLDANAVLQGNCVVSSVDLPDAFDPQGDRLGANGIVPFADGLLVDHLSDGSVYYINLKGDAVPQQVIEDGVAPSADGLTLFYGDDGKVLLYVTQILENEIGVFSLTVEEDKISAIKRGSLTSPLFNTPSTSAIYKGYIYSCMLLFGTDFAAEADDYVVAIRNVFDSL